jgi:alanyl-tRNA synthetase
MAKGAQSVGGIAFISRRIDGVDEKQLREVADRLKESAGLGLVVIATVQEDKVSFVVSVQKDVATRGVHAGQLAKELAALIQGSGGGRPDFAQGGGKNVAALDSALGQVGTMVKRLSIKTPHKA